MADRLPIYKKGIHSSLRFVLSICLFFIGLTLSASNSDRQIVRIGNQTDYLIKSTESALLLPPSWDKYANKTNLKLVTPRSLEVNGNLRLVLSSDWCSGFFPGNLWFLYNLKGKETWKQKAEHYTLEIEPEKLNGTTHDMGFKMLCSFGNGYRLTKNREYEKILIESAYTLSKRFNPKAGVILSWDHSKERWGFPVIIDNMMNLELLFFAFHHTGDSLFFKIAVSHANATLKNHFRADYSCYHVVDYNPETGAVVKKTTHQGLNDESAWARGQGWALYGFVMMYRETKNPVYLTQAEHIASFILNHKNLPSDKVPYFDFDAQPGKQTPRDASAAAIIASALYEFSQYKTQKTSYYRQTADLIMNSLSGPYFSEPGTNKGFLLMHSTGSMPQNSEVDVPLIYADYYYLEALVRQKMLNEKGMIEFNTK